MGRCARNTSLASYRGKTTPRAILSDRRGGARLDCGVGTRPCGCWPPAANLSPAFSLKRWYVCRRSGGGGRADDGRARAAGGAGGKRGPRGPRGCGLVVHVLHARESLLEYAIGNHFFSPLFLMES
ncbi:hypothetical protein EMIHUDRAFT_444099 [Emiliania huxleyi CCMP1516]|uniref:Uncharacterized protein n=2 Tax=Emiliania huxleyi TaxID=2903 RepID=A0A0D3JJ12_EMIH1|nr:hypothetical protein EMIHUDRAFT_444099 [Emiliania huxleyi CCMP1516]EOD23497.1 hypothetical protein EMIHUDRAFT_444099 [Emiliania huxleyi CCMP1516]|eukprot:XP_005775926.1 hypothetical protein EMIHUDRAFT_444099 [Emiliania huxleyi CCMP1516]